MIIYTHGIESGLKMTTQRLANMGWVVTGKHPKALGFRVLAVESHGKGFKTRDEARIAMKQVKG